MDEVSGTSQARRGDAQADAADVSSVAAPVAERKAALRRQLLAARRSRSAEELAALRAALVAVVCALVADAGWRRVAAYEPLRTEPGSVELLTALTEAGVQVLVPITLPDRDLDWEPWPARGALGVDAVRSVDAVLVPALAVDRDGTRLGRGGGSYDRALARSSAVRVALVFDDEVFGEEVFGEEVFGASLGGGTSDMATGVSAADETATDAMATDGPRGTLPRDPWDQAVDLVATPSGWRELRNTRVADSD